MKTQDTETPSKTYQVLDAIKSGHLKKSAISKATGISNRAVSAILYALEKQDRVQVDSYKKSRADQKFKVIRYEANLKKGIERIHPTKRDLLERAKNTDFAYKVPDLQRFFFSSAPEAARLAEA